jgi:hypothetical protein
MPDNGLLTSDHPRVAKRLRVCCSRVGKLIMPAVALAALLPAMSEHNRLREWLVAFYNSFG